MFQVDRIVTLWKARISQKIVDGRKVFLVFFHFQFFSWLPVEGLVSSL